MTRTRRHSNTKRPWGPGRVCLRSAGPVHGLIIVAVLVFAGLEASAWGQQCKLTQGEFSITRPDPAPPVRYAEESEQVSVLTYAVSLNGDLYLEVTVDNHTTRPLTFERAWLTEGERDPIEIEMVMDRSVERSDDGITVVPPDTMIRGVVLVPDSVQSGVEALSITLTGPNGAPGIVAKQFVELYPVPDEMRRRRRMDKQVAVSVRLLGGGFWTDDAAGQDMIDGTTMAGVGVRVQKGMHHNFAFEAEMQGARTGESRFQDVSWRGMSGTITRRASLARVQAAGVIRFGQAVVVSSKLGFGAQLLSYDTEFIEGDTLIVGPGDGLTFQGLWTAGAGLDIRLGEHWSLGAAAGTTFAFQGAERLLDIGFYLGYGWSPAEMTR